MNKGKILALAMMIFGLMALIAGCGNKSSDAVVVWAMGEEGNRLGDFVKDYEEKTGQKVIVTAIPWNMAHSKILTAVASRKGPDVLQLGTTWVTEFADAESLAVLDGYVAQYPNLDPKNYFEGIASLSYFDNQMIAVPWMIETRVLFYRTDLLAAVGYPDGPDTWEEMLDAAKKLMANGSTIGFDVNNIDQTLIQTFTWQAGGELFDANGQPLFTSSEVNEAVTFLTRFFREGGSLWNHGLDVNYNFADGKVPMFISGPWMVTLLDEVEGFTNWNVKVMPEGPSGRASPVGGSALTVFKYSDKIEQAVAFINWMNEESTQLKWYEVVSALPARKSAWSQPLMQRDPRVVVFGQQLEHSRLIPSLPYFERVVQEGILTTERIFGYDADIRSQLLDLQNKALEIVANNS